MKPNDESVVGGTTPWPILLKHAHLWSFTSEPKDRLGSVPYLFAPLPNVATLTKSFFCLPLLTVSLRIGDRTGLGAQVVTPPPPKFDNNPTADGWSHSSQLTSGHCEEQCHAH